MLIDTLDAALEDREIALDGIGMGVASDVFLDGVVDALMRGKFFADGQSIPRFQSSAGW